jgi:multiple sugar transport system permease protein
MAGRRAACDLTGLSKEGEMSAINANPRRMLSLERRNLIWGLVFTSPWILGVLFFVLYPLAISLYYSLTRYDFIRPPVFIGLDNYVDLITSDSRFWTVMYNTLYYVVVGVPLGVAFAFIVACTLNTRLVGRSFFRGLIYVPSIIPAVCSAMVWQFLLNIQFGAINGLLQTMQLPAIPFLANPSFVKPSLIGIYIWGQGAAVVIFLAALQDIPRALYEAALVDGANAWQRFRHVTVPLMTPIILFNLIIGVITASQEFTMPWLVTSGTGGPLRAGELFSIYLYRTAFVDLRMGKASAMSWILFAIIIIFSILLFKSSARWVYYGGEK